MEVAILTSVTDKQGGKDISAIAGHLHFNDTSIEVFCEIYLLGVDSFALVLQIRPC